MRWTLQKPATQARECNVQKVNAAEGNLAGPKKKARRHKAWIFFQDESGVSQRPSIRRTWAPRGETPVLVHAFNWKKMSLSAAMDIVGTEPALGGSFKPVRTVTTQRLIRYLEDLRRKVRGRKAVLVWMPCRRIRVG